MFTFDKHDLQRFAVSSVGAVALSAACIFGVAGPVRAATPNAPLTITDWQQVVEHRLEGLGAVPSDSNEVRETVIAVRLTADGDFAGAAIARSSGDRAIDREALAVARDATYPALPASYRGHERMVMARIFSGTSAEAVEAERAKARRAANVRYAGADTGARVRIAAK